MKQKIKRIGMVALLLMVTRFISSAYDFESGGIFYKILSEDEKTVGVTDGNSEDVNKGDYFGNVIIPSSVNHDGVDYTVSKIYYLRGLGLLSLHIPATVKEIKILYESAHYILDSRGFRIHAPESKFTTITVDEGNTEFSSFDGALYNKDQSDLIYIPSGKTSITFSDKLRRIKAGAFEGSQITDLRLPETLIEIEVAGLSSFYNDNFLTSISIPNSVTNTNSDDLIIQGLCPHVISIDLPANLIDKMFSKKGYFDCNVWIHGYDEVLSQLKHIGINGESEYFNWENEMIYSKDKTTLYHCPPALSNLSFNPALKSIGYGAFQNFHGIDDLILPEGIVEIGEQSTGNLSSLTLPSTLKSTSYISTGGDLYSLSLTPPSVNYHRVDNFLSIGSGNKIYVYPSALEAYKNAEGWKNYAAQLTAIDNFTKQGIMSADDCETTKGKQFNLPINLNNYNTTPTVYSGFQFDIEMPEGLSIADVKISDELTAAGFEADNSSIESNPVRIISYKTNGTGVSATEGIVTLTIKADANATEGEKTIKFTNAKLSSAGGTSLPLDDSSVTVTVKSSPVSAVNVAYSSGKEGDLYVGDSAVYSATATPADASDKTVTWSIEDASVASITTGDDNSKVTVNALKIGETTLKATANDGSGVVGTAVIKVVATPISSVVIESQDNKTSLFPDETLALTAKINPATATTPVTYKWTSDTPAVATVTDNAASVTLTAIKTGTANITVVATNQAGNVTSENFTVTVASRPIASVTLSEEGPLNLDLYKNKEKTLTATVNPSNATDPSVTWTSNKPEVATVENGKITAVSLGTAVITVAATNATSNITTKITVNVVATPAEEITISGGKHDLKVTEEMQLTANVTPAETTYPEVEWTSSDATKASVDNTGKVTAKAAGQATITATVKATPAVKATFDVTITNLILGDANDDGYVDVADVVTIVNEYLNLPNDNEAVLIAYDFNNNDEADEYDWKKTLDIIIGQVGSRSYSAYNDFAYSELLSNDKLMVSESNGFGSYNKNIGLELTHTNDYVTMIVEVILPSEANVVSVTKGNKISNHSVAYNVVDGNRLKIAIYSMKNEVFGNDKSLLNIELSNISDNEHVRIDEVYATDAGSQRYSLGWDTDYAGIDNIAAGEDGIYHVFTVQGFNVMNTPNADELKELVPGIYIINGKKVMINK